MDRDRAFRRYQRQRTINRKVRLLLRIGGKELLNGWARGAYGRFSKGKIHCSCWMCRTKSYDELPHREKKLALRATDD